MRLLALETSLAASSVALFDGDCLVACERLEERARVARALVPAMQQALASAGWRPGDVQIVAAAIGPGSFTGLRVGVTAAKTFAYAVGAAALGVSTLEAIAFAAPAQAGIICPVIDAQRKQLFAARYRRESGELQCLEGAHIASIDLFLATLGPGDVVTGPGLGLASDLLPAHVQVVDARYWPPSAEHVGRLAWRDYEAGRRGDPMRLAPMYIRESAAEEKAKK
jgi:tRNA threonylcarbamoyladenosine biosynthesis protein TsaB